MTMSGRYAIEFPHGMRARSSRLLIVGLLLLALPVYGLSGLITELLGAKHGHEQVPATSDGLLGWQDFRRVTASAPAPHAHSHQFWKRHHHSTSDASVIALAGAAQDLSSGDAATVSASSGTLGMACSIAIISRPDDASSAWPRHGPDRVTTLAVEPPERPPKA